MNSLLRTGLILIGLISLLRPSPANAGTSAGAQLTILSTTAQALELALTVHDYTVKRDEQAGGLVQQITIANTELLARPGQARLPVRSVMLGLPSSVGITLTVLAADFTTHTGFHLAQAAPFVLEQMAPDDDPGPVPVTANLLLPAAQTAPWAPAEPVALGEVGQLREQAVAQLHFYPVQYAAQSGDVRIYRRIVVRLTWAEPVSTAATAAPLVNPAYESFLQQALFNYATLRRPQVAAAAAVLPTVAPRPTATTPTFATPTLKIGITATGLYRLTYADLQAAGLDPATLDPRTLHLHQQTTEQAIRVEGEADGVFDPTDSILFYGTALADPYTATNVYWLTVDASPGLRMQQQAGTLVGATSTPAAFPTAVHAEEDTVHWQPMVAAGEDRWFWGRRLAANTAGFEAARTYPVRLTTVATAAPARLQVRLKGFTGLNHRTRLWLNNRLVDEQSWFGQVQFTHDVNVPGSYLVNGENHVQVEVVPVGSNLDQVLVNWLELAYDARYVAAADQLTFGAPAAGPTHFVLSDFSSDQLELFEVTDPTAPIQIINPVVARTDRHYRLEFQATAQLASRYLAVTAAQVLRPATLTLDQPTAWRSPTNGADYIIITHEAFYASALTLAAHRQAAGLRVAVVQVGDIYDEFNAGIFSPQAIRAFLTYAYQNWQAPAPLYVVLLGDAKQDFKDNRKTGVFNFVPSPSLDGEFFGEVSSDLWYAQVSGADALPDLFMGRLVAQNAAEASAMVTNIIQYEQNPPDPTWNRRVLLVADDDEPEFAALTEQLAARLPFYYQPQRLLLEDYPPGDPTAALIDQLNTGAVLVNYAGHGEYFGWGQWDQNRRDLFTNADVTRLHNEQRLPLITMANCLSGFFTGPHDAPALAEVLQRQPDGGAIGIWAPANRGYAAGHTRLLTELYRAIFVDDQTTLGAAVTAAGVATLQQDSFWRELVATYVLFADPATPLGLPTNYPYLVSATPAAGAVDLPLDQPLELLFNKPLDPATVLIQSDDPTLSFTPTWTAANTLLQLEPHGFRAGQSYTLLVQGQDRLGNALGVGQAPTQWSFSLTADQLAPTVDIQVAGGEAAALTTTVLDLTFSEPLRPESVTYQLTPADAAPVFWENDAQRLQVVYQHLPVGQTYTFNLLSATDRAGNALAAPVQFTFTVRPTQASYLPITVNRSPLAP